MSGVNWTTGTIMTGSAMYIITITVLTTILIIHGIIIITLIAAAIPIIFTVIQKLSVQHPSSSRIISAWLVIQTIITITRIHIQEVIKYITIPIIIIQTVWEKLSEPFLKGITAAHPAAVIPLQAEPTHHQTAVHHRAVREEAAEERNKTGKKLIIDLCGVIYPGTFCNVSGILLS